VPPNVGQGSLFPMLFTMRQPIGLNLKVLPSNIQKRNILSFNPWPPSAILAHSNMAKHRQWRVFAVT